MISKRLLNLMVILLILQPMMVLSFESDDQADLDDRPGVVVNPASDAGLADQDVSSEQEDRTTQVTVNTPFWNMQLNSDNPIVQLVIGAVFLCVSLELVRAYVASKGLQE